MLEEAGHLYLYCVKLHYEKQSFKEIPPKKLDFWAM
jgi:hypothetical protein